jgi:hypothetical protein
LAACIIAIGSPPEPHRRSTSGKLKMTDSKGVSAGSKYEAL